MQPKRSLEQRINKVKHIRKNAPQPGGHAFQQTGTIFKLVQDEKCSASWRSWFSLTGTVIKLVRRITRANVLTKFHEDRTINVASRVFTRFFFSHKRKICPAPDGHVFQSTGTIYSNSSKILMGHC
ncbi:hypothetical protein DPMN_105926 [Dreissena polymorpha]|uniref:Uncharacterized protein n=1 Tax=Dreissena polymorpha TaxID=45954 RepID=A0A9D4QI80_DREPO|nr:hypothetical protein DPMN_105926 [Dreissena polymorpha]